MLYFIAALHSVGLILILWTCIDSRRSQRVQDSYLNELNSIIGEPMPSLDSVPAVSSEIKKIGTSIKELVIKKKQKAYIPSRDIDLKLSGKREEFFD